MINELIKNRKPGIVFICPLDWGLGHATRVIPVILSFHHHGWKIILGGSGKSGAILRRSFPGLPYESVESYSVKYIGNSWRLLFSVCLQLPFFINSLFQEHRKLRSIIARYNIDTVVSDNRYGLFSPDTHNILITHQLSPVLPKIVSWAEYPLYLIIKMLVSKFDECWIPDRSGPENLTGDLSHRYKLPANSRFVGWLTRFTDYQGFEIRNTYDIVISLSGPQPQLKYFTRKILFQAGALHCKVLIIAGLQEVNRKGLPENIEVVSHLETGEFLNALKTARLIICRSGYSSIMDLMEIQKTAVLVPTPGQPEQEYLGRRMEEMGLFRFVKQSDFDLKKLCETI